MTILDQWLLDLGLFFYPFSLFYPLRCAKCVSIILNIIVFTPVINIGVLASIIIQVYIYIRLLIKCLPLKNINNDTLNTSG
jgi:hypothetical protein